MTMANDMTTADGFAVAERSGGLIIGKLLKFINGHYVADKTEPVALGTELVALNVVTCWTKWQDGKPDHRITHPGQCHPERDELPDRDETAWEEGLDGKPSDPWRDARYVHLVNPRTGAEFTFVTDSHGGRKGVGELKSSVANVRFAHPGAVPVVQLRSTTFPTRHGPKPRPQFEIVGWKTKSSSTSAMAEITDQRQQKIENKTSRTKIDMDDEIPF